MCYYPKKYGESNLRHIASRKLIGAIREYVDVCVEEAVSGCAKAEKEGYQDEFTIANPVLHAVERCVTVPLNARITVEDDKYRIYWTEK